MMDGYFSCAYMACAVLNTWLRPDMSALSITTAGGTTNKQPPLPPPRQKRHIVLSGSFVSLQEFADNARKAPSEAAIRSLAQKLADEIERHADANLAKTPICVHLVMPAKVLASSLEDRTKLQTTHKSVPHEDQLIHPSCDMTKPADFARFAVTILETGYDFVLS